MALLALLEQRGDSQRRRELWHSERGVSGKLRVTCESLEDVTEVAVTG